LSDRYARLEEYTMLFQKELSEYAGMRDAEENAAKRNSYRVIGRRLDDLLTAIERAKLIEADQEKQHQGC